MGDWLHRVPAVYVGLTLLVTLVQLLSLAAAWRPSLHRAAGAAVILFHVATYLSLGIFFKQSVMLAALLLLASPFARVERR